MSERGSFVTEYIYCGSCLTATRDILIDNRKEQCAIELPSWQGEGRTLPIIAGKIGGSYQGEELEIFEVYFIPLLAQRICHPLRIAVLADKGEQIYTIHPAESS